MANKNDLRVWHIPQVPGKPFHFEVGSPREGLMLMEALAQYDHFQFTNNIKPDYSNANGLEVFEDGEWVTWYDDDGYDIGDYDYVNGEMVLTD